MKSLLFHRCLTIFPSIVPHGIILKCQEREGVFQWTVRKTGIFFRNNPNDSTAAIQQPGEDRGGEGQLNSVEGTKPKYIFRPPPIGGRTVKMQSVRASVQGCVLKK